MILLDAFGERGEAFPPHRLFLIGGELPDGAHRHSRVDVDAQDPRDALPRRLRLVTVDPDRRYCAMVKRSRLYVEF